MSFAVNNDVRFTAGRGEETWVPGTGTFTGLDDADQQILVDWLDHAGAHGIDAALDFSVRPWGVIGTGAIVGVFETGKHHASWLLVRHGSGWVLARRKDGFVSDEMSSLAAVLALIDAHWGS